MHYVGLGLPGKGQVRVWEGGPRWSTGQRFFCLGVVSFEGLIGFEESEDGGYLEIGPLSLDRLGLDGLDTGSYWDGNMALVCARL